MAIGYLTNLILDIHVNNDMNINTHIDVNMNIGITPPTRCPPSHPAPFADGPGMGRGGRGDINVHIDTNMNIDIHITINMNNKQQW